jgi:proteasome alpha subunit
MTAPFYVSPEQVMKDRADYALQRVARGRPVVALTYADGVLIVAENSSRSQHKISEIYDRIAFAGVGRYNEFDQLRVAGVRHADTKGYAYSREDVDARSLANTYAQYVGQIFTHEMKPLEVDILVAELGAGDTPDQMYHISYDGSIVDEQRVTVLGGQAEVIAERAGASWRAGWTLREALRSSVAALAGPDRQLALSELEVAVLARSNERRAFQRLGPTELAELLEGDTTVDPPSSEA